MPVQQVWSKCIKYFCGCFYPFVNKIEWIGFDNLICMFEIYSSFSGLLMFSLPACAILNGYNVSMLLSLTIFNCPLGDQLSQNVLDRSSPNFQDMYMYGWAWSIQPSFYDRSRVVTTVTDRHQSAVLCNIHLSIQKIQDTRQYLQDTLWRYFMKDTFAFTCWFVLVCILRNAVIK